MMPTEFKAWFEGYTEGLKGAPTKAQFDRIKEKVKEINGTPITQTVYLRDYVRPYWTHPTYGTNPSFGYATGAIGSGTVTMYGGAAGGSMGGSNTFDSRAAMYALGKAEASN